MLLRFRATDGQFRVQAEPTDTLGFVQAKVCRKDLLDLLDLLFKSILTLLKSL